jgi:hypothetical protein
LRTLKGNGVFLVNLWFRVNYGFTLFIPNPPPSTNSSRILWEAQLPISEGLAPIGY